MIKVLFLLGTRPEAIKFAPVIKELQRRKEVETRVAVTAQHREMLDSVLNFFNIIPDFDLDLMVPGQSLPQLTANVIRTVPEKIFSQYKPDWVMVQGDTTTAMAGALSAFYNKIPVAHVEAGLRSHRMDSPFPEEMNRVVISKLASHHFCPTRLAVQNLTLEGITDHVHEVGNTVVDAAEMASAQLRTVDQKIHELFFKSIDFRKKVILVTCHRRESFGEPFEEICRALLALAENENYHIVYPVHLNPNVQEIAYRMLLHPGITLMDPLNYPQLLWLMSKSALILTDSGGIQEEAPTFRKPVLVLREVTERMEGIESGAAILVGTDRKKIVDKATSILSNPVLYQSMISKPNPYGDGKTAGRIAEILIEGE